MANGFQRMPHHIQIIAAEEISPRRFSGPYEKDQIHVLRPDPLSPLMSH